SHRARGVAAQLAHDQAQATTSLAEVWEYMRREGVDEPGAFPVAPDLVEALVELGRVQEAQDVAGRLRTLSEEQQHPWGLASTKRCDGLIAFASGSNDEAATGLAGAAEDYGRLDLPFDRARSHLCLGRALRRLRKWGAARDNLEQAVAEFDQLGSPGWADEARSELARVGGRRKQTSDELTPTERRVAELAADGLANKEIARNLFVSV